MTETFLETYFKNMAISVKDISHEDTPTGTAFYRMVDPMDLDEFDNAVKNMSKSCCLLLELGDGSIGEWDSQRDAPRIGLHILNKTTDLFSDKNAARDQAKATLIKIVAQMRYDCKTQFERTDGTIGPLKALNVIFDSNIKFSNMSGIDTNWYGKSFYFEFKAPVNMVRNANDYN